MSKIFAAVSKPQGATHTQAQSAQSEQHPVAALQLTLNDNNKKKKPQQDSVFNQFVAPVELKKKAPTNRSLQPSLDACNYH